MLFTRINCSAFTFMQDEKTNDKTTNLNINPPTYHFKKQIKNYTNFYTKYINIKIN